MNNGMAGIFALGLLCSSVAADDDLYIYLESDGTKWLTDRKIANTSYELVGRYGRPTAQSSCSGITSQILEERYKPHQPTIEHYAKQYDLDVEFIKAIISVESCFDTYAVSRVGAQGLMQLMPKTAQYLGVSNSFNAHQNIRGGTRYISEMMKQFKGNKQLALAAYNAGPTAVKKYGGIPPYKETQTYVKRVLRFYETYTR